VGWWRNRRENGRRRAIQRQDRGYPGGWHRLAVAVPDSEWVSQFDAAEALGINLGRVGLMIGAGVLQAAENPAKQAGVTLESVEREIEWRRIAPLRSRVWRVISYGLSQI